MMGHGKNKAGDVRRLMMAALLLLIASPFVTQSNTVAAHSISCGQEKEPLMIHLFAIFRYAGERNCITALIRVPVMLRLFKRVNISFSCMHSAPFKSDDGTGSIHRLPNTTLSG